MVPTVRKQAGQGGKTGLLAMEVASLCRSPVNPVGPALSAPPRQPRPPITPGAAAARPDSQTTGSTQGMRGAPRTTKSRRSRCLGRQNLPPLCARRPCESPWVFTIRQASMPTAYHRHRRAELDERRCVPLMFLKFTIPQTGDQVGEFEQNTIYLFFPTKEDHDDLHP